VTKPVLVAYASRAGSTAGVAQAVGRSLTAHGLLVEVRHVTEVDDVTPYQAVVVGSAIRIDRWLPEAMDFIQRHRADLAQRPTAAFLVCMALGLASTPQQRAQAEKSADAYMQPIRTLINPASEGMFGGALKVSAIKEPYWRLAFGLIVGLRVWREADYRSWKAIQQWADGLPVALKLTASALQA
jgi:menaquinone-dependent protoporphyrinogen oxidase